MVTALKVLISAGRFTEPPGHGDGRFTLGDVAADYENNIFINSLAGLAFQPCLMPDCVDCYLLVPV